MNEEFLRTCKYKCGCEITFSCLSHTQEVTKADEEYAYKDICDNCKDKKIMGSRLFGSEKQIEWATDIRYEFIKEYKEYVCDKTAEIVKTEEIVKKALEIKDSKFWIDNRNANYKMWNLIINY